MPAPCQLRNSARGISPATRREFRDLVCPVVARGGGLSEQAIRREKEVVLLLLSLVPESLDRALNEGGTR